MSVLAWVFRPLTFLYLNEASFGINLALALQGHESNWVGAGINVVGVLASVYGVHMVDSVPEVR